MRAFIAMQIMFGVKPVKDMNLVWSTIPWTSYPWYSSIMTRNRYWVLSRYFHVRDTSDTPLRGSPNYDPLFKVRPMIDRLNERSAELYKPGQHLSVDEAMIAFDGRHSSKQYLPSKPHPYGFKVWVCAESVSGYALQVEVYTGKAPSVEQTAVRKEFGLGYDVVSRLTEQYQYKYHVIYYDRYFSSVPLAEMLLARQTYCCSTVHLNRKGLPVEAKKLIVASGVVVEFQKGNLLLVIFNEKRQVAHLSTASTLQTIFVMWFKNDGNYNETN